MTTHYFPDADVPALQPFTQAFVRMMFAHAAFEHRVSDLMNVITGIVGFGERLGPLRRGRACRSDDALFAPPPPRAACSAE
jgi:hypothetical protein